MQRSILLPNTENHPDYRSADIVLDATIDNLNVAIQALRDQPTPDAILGSHKTPAIWWLAAQLAFNKTKALLNQQNDWIDLQQSTSPIASPKNETTAHVKAAETKPVETPKAAKTTTANASASTQDTKTDTNTKQWISDTYKYHAWKDPKAPHYLTERLEAAEKLNNTHPTLADELRKAARQGKRAAELTQELKQRQSKGESAEAITHWIQSLEGKESKRAINHLQIRLKKDQEYKTNKCTQRKQSADFNITLPYTELVNNRHPQSLLALKPSQQWTILIDETGTVFSTEAETLNESDTKLGRIIALAMPQNHNLPDLKEKTHAIDLNHRKIQELLSSIVKSPCGVLGATLKRDLNSHNWMSSVTQLARWVLLMLPIEDTTRVKVMIENRGQFNSKDTLLALQENLDNELKQLAPERFRDVHLTLDIMQKEHPHNGYVDVIANCWGSSDPIKRKLLARTGWRGHCLMQTDNLSRIEYLYRHVSQAADVTAEDWFQLCHEAANEPEHSLLNDILKQLGQQSSTNPAQWQRYLRAVQQHITNKTYSATSLNRALAWLQENRPNGCSLPGLLSLQYQSAQLAAANHLGRTDLSTVQNVIQLANTLCDESAPDACEAILRIAISATNSFDFASPIGMIESWLEHPVATVGLVNHGKLQSTLGQLNAFNGNLSESIEWFERALATFQRLSDPQRRQREQQQTRIYHAIALIDSAHPETDNTVVQLLNQATGKHGADTIKHLSRSGDSLRFEHYLLLRWLINSSDQQTTIDTYLSTEDNWQSDDAHPWMLINAYRAWLLVRAGRKTEAHIHLQEAIDDCQQHHDSAVLNGMAHTLSALAHSLGLPPNKHLHDPLPQGFRTDQLSQLSRAATDQERLAALNTLLPFNFH